MLITKALKDMSRIGWPKKLAYKRASPEKIEENRVKKMKRDEFFNTIWKKRKPICQVSGRYLGYYPNSMFFHHILPKSKYKEAEFDEENIVLLHPDIHASVELDMDRFPIINEMREKLKEKYGIT